MQVVVAEALAWAGKEVLLSNVVVSLRHDETREIRHCTALKGNDVKAGAKVHQWPE